MKGYRAVGVGDKVHGKGAGVGGQEPGDEGESAGGEGHGSPLTFWRSRCRPDFSNKS